MTSPQLYQLTDPTKYHIYVAEYEGRPIYVGFGTGTFTGHRIHMNDKSKFSGVDYTKIEWSILKEFVDKFTALEYEKELILLYGRLDQGTGNLFNTSKGGEGGEGGTCTGYAVHVHPTKVFMGGFLQLSPPKPIVFKNAKSAAYWFHYGSLSNDIQIDSIKRQLNKVLESGRGEYRGYIISREQYT